MVYAHKVVRCTLSGTMFNGLENWSTGFFLGLKDGDATAPTQAGADQIRDAFQTLFTTSGGAFGGNYKFTTCKLASLDTAGKTIPSEVVYSYTTGTVSGGNNLGAALPPQCALVVTLTSPRPRGLASKGRMYLPGIAGAVGTDGKVAGTLMAGISTQLKTFFDAVNGYDFGAHKLILAAKGTGALPALTAQNDWVTGFRVGDVIDTQRRRRNGLTEVYTMKTLA